MSLATSEASLATTALLVSTQDQAPGRSAAAHAPNQSEAKVGVSALPGSKSFLDARSAISSTEAIPAAAVARRSRSWSRSPKTWLSLISATARSKKGRCNDSGPCRTVSTVRRILSSSPDRPSSCSNHGIRAATTISEPDARQAVKPGLWFIKLPDTKLDRTGDFLGRQALDVQALGDCVIDTGEPHEPESRDSAV